MSSSPLLILIDGHSLAFRAYYAFAKSRDGGLRTSTGIPTNICFGFLKSLLQVMEKEKPQGMGIAFDLGEPTFRHQAYDAYKAGRKETPDDFVPDMVNLQELLGALNLPILTSPGYEADDVLATVAKQGSSQGYQVKIVTGDRDLFQLVNPEEKISILYLDKNAVSRSGKGNATEFGTAEVETKLGVKPSQVVDFKALCGDKSDNIPGVRGIGEKTAVKLLSEYGNLGSVYDNLEKIKGATKKKLEQGREDAESSRFLAQLIYDAPLDLVWSDLQLQGFDTANLKPLLEKLELNTFLGQINQLQQQFGGSVEEVEDVKESGDEGTWFWSYQDTLDVHTGDDLRVAIAPEIIDTSEKLNDLIKRLEKCTDIPVAWDTETTSLEPSEAELVGIGCCWGTGENDVAYIPTAHTEGNYLEKQEVLSALRNILESSAYPKAFQNAKFDRLVLEHQGIKLEGVTFDTMLASYVLHPGDSHKLSDLCIRYLSGINSLDYDELDIPKGKSIADLSIQKVAKYCGLDAYATFCLVEKLSAELSQFPDLEKLLREVEVPLEPVLAEMENQGIRIDSDYLNQLSQQLETNLEKIEQQAYEQAGEEFKLSSPKQLSVLLFEKLELNRKKSRKTKTGYSTDHATLEKLRGDHPVIESILEYRTLAKLKSTYVDALPAIVNSKTNRIHTDFNQTVTATGRLSSSNPNLQNIPIRTEFSRQIRKAFIPQENWLLVAADYSQIELRILAHYSQEPVLVDAYKYGRDVHTVTAQMLFDKEEITSDERRLGKVINFGVIYGMGAQRFARESGIAPSEGKKFIERYREKYSQVFAYLESMKQQAIAHGYVTTILGRRRYFNFVSENLRNLKGNNPQEIDLSALKSLGQYDSQLLRAAANSTIQGSSADIIKVAMVRLHKILQNYQARLLLQVHDELVFEVPPQEWEELQPQIKSVMEGAVSLDVPLVVEVNEGQNWMETK